MARVSALVFLQLSVLLVLSTSSNGLPLEDRLEQLTRDFVRKLNLFFCVSPLLITLKICKIIKKIIIFNEKVKVKDLLAVKDARLEELESKVTHLEELKSKVTRLEETVQKQETMIIALQQKEIAIGSAEFIPSHLALNGQIGKGVSFPRTCRELRAWDPTLTSGMHWIDPDGQGVGDAPIYVYCDMTKGINSLFMFYLKI